MRANDAISGLVIIILSAAMIALTASFPDFQGQKYGPALFPRVLGGLLILCGGLIVYNGLAQRRAGTPWIGIAPWVRDPWRLGSFLLVLVSLIVYIVASETVGFIPVALLFLAALFFWLGVRPVTAIVTAVATTLLMHWFFSSLLRVPLPRGWLTNIL